MKNSSKYILLLIFTVILYGLLYKVKVTSEVNLFIFDKVTSLFYKNHKNLLNSTVIVEIDDESLVKFGQWPWSRLIMAKIIQEIYKARPAVIGLDIIFSEVDRTSPKFFEDFYKKNLKMSASFDGIPKKLNDNDKVFASVLRQTNTILPIIITSKDSGTSCIPNTIFHSLGSFESLPYVDNFMCNLPILQESIRYSGFVNAMINNDGFMRKYNLFVRNNKGLVPSLVLAMLQSIDPNLYFKEKSSFFKRFSLQFIDHTIISNERGEVFNHVYPRSNFTRVSASKILSGEVNASIFLGKFVLMGATAIGLSDQHMVKSGENVPGLFAHASLIENIINDSLLFSPSVLVNIMFLVSLLCVFVSLTLIFYKKYVQASLFIFGLTVFAFVLVWIGIKNGIYLPIGHFIFPLFIAYIILLFIFSFLFFMEEKYLMQELTSTRTSIINSMMMVVETRDAETGKHIIRTREYAKLLSEYLAKNTKYKEELTPQKIKLIYQATPLHDIGKIGIPDYILQKSGKLTDEEMRAMKEHSNIGHHIIDKSIDEANKHTNSFLQVAANIALSHHEKWDGTGYPQGLKEDEIPLEGRIVALADVYDALISRRCYKEAMSFEVSEKIIEKGRGNHFDPIVVDAFIVLKVEFRDIAKRNSD